MVEGTRIVSKYQIEKTPLTSYIFSPCSEVRLVHYDHFLKDIRYWMVAYLRGFCVYVLPERKVYQ
jgi:hypothetical protein